MSRKPGVLVVAGTRPEGIKLAPVVSALRSSGCFDTRLAVTGQHREMLAPILQFFGLVPDYDLQLMTAGQTLSEITSRALVGLKQILDELRPELVVVQGDTTTAFAAALAAYYEKRKIAHVEAGLRTGKKYSPFPEEANRALVSRVADFHFAPTETAKRNLFAEGIRDGVHVVGNTVIDALFSAKALIAGSDQGVYERAFEFLEPGRRLLLVTGHRRESFGSPFEDMCFAMKRIASSFPDVELLYPVHLNPNVRGPVERILRGTPRVHLVEPVDYPHLVWLLDRAHFVLTDSGGIQEEAPAFGKPVLVMREVTERPEGVEAGCAKLVGTDPDKIFSEAARLLTDGAAYSAMARTRSPYGDGTASQAITRILSSALG